MRQDAGRRDDFTPFLLVALLNLLVFVGLFLARSLDDNRLTSWQWVMDGGNPSLVFLLTGIGVFIAYGISRIEVPEKHGMLLLGVCASAACIPFWQIPEVIIDSSRYFAQAKHLEIHGIQSFFSEWGRGIRPWTDTPLLPFLYGILFRFLGEQRIWIQAFTTMTFVLTVILTYGIGRSLWGREIGLMGGALLLGMPYLITQVPLMLVDVPTMFFLSLSVFAFLQALERGGGLRILGASCAASLALFAKYSTWLMLSVLIVIFLVFLFDPPSAPRGAEGDTVAGRARRVVLLRGFMVFLVAAVMSSSVFFAKFEVFSEQIRFLAEYQKPGLGRWGESFVSTFLFQVHPFITAAALFSVYVAIRKKDVRFAVILWLVLMVMVFEIRRIRYIVLVFPMLSLMAAYSLREIPGGSLKRFIVSCAIVSSLVVALFAYLPFLKNISTVNLRDAGEYLNTLDAGEVEVFTVTPAGAVAAYSFAVPLLDLHTDKEIYYDQELDQGIVPPEEVKTSPLRFAWEFRSPLYYGKAAKATDQDLVIAVISGGNDPEDLFAAVAERLTDAYKLTRVFDVSEGVFQLQTVVRVYERMPSTPRVSALWPGCKGVEPQVIN